MNARVLLLVPLTSLLVPLLPAQSPTSPPPPVPVDQAPADNHRQALLTPPAGEDQRVYGPVQGALITPDAARALSERFRAAYGQSSSPRLVVYVNRALGDSPSGLKLTGRTEKHYQTTANGKEGPTTTTDHSSESTYAAGDTPKSTLADQQTVREVERLFGRVFRNAGAQLADARAAMALLPDAPAGRLAGDEAAKERDALKQVADIAIEVLIASRNLNVTTVSGDSVYTVPDIQATAIRLNDAAIVGQASTSDILGHSQQAGRIARQFSIADITEATAFAVMEDMLTGAKP
jgi:hypothetical protein